MFFGQFSDTSYGVTLWTVQIFDHMRFFSQLKRGLRNAREMAHANAKKNEYDNMQIKLLATGNHVNTKINFMFNDFYRQ